MLTKEAVIEYTEEFLAMEGYEIEIQDHKHYVLARKEGQTLKVVTLGEVNDMGSTSKQGKSFNKNQIRINLGLALFEISKQMTLDLEGKENYGISIPDTILFMKRANEIKQVFNALNIRVLLINGMGLVKEL